MSLPRSLVDQSTLTHRQFESLQLYVKVVSGEMKYRDAATLATKSRTRGARDKPLTIGSYFRTVQQARENTRRSIITLLIGIWTGVVRPEDVRRLLDVAGTGFRELSDEESEKLAGVLHALVRNIVM